jgi:hypothetical protein
MSGDASDQDIPLMTVVCFVIAFGRLRTCNVL